jgi:non-canonical purine NTP pyrophosphatase (RdgB/HAM1 family)
LDEKIMDKIYFVTGNDGKFKEAKALMPELEQIHIALPEEQSLDPQVIIAKKLEAAANHTPGKYIVEDTSLYLEGMNGFPGPLVKWLRKSVGNQGISELVKKLENSKATAKTVIGYSDGKNPPVYFEGEQDGKIVAPSGAEGFGWDEIFMPDGLNETFAEMGDEYKPEFSMRTIAFRKLKEYLENTK